MSRSVERELLQHTGALRRLAQHLVGAQHADDLVQDTALLALQSPPKRPGPLGGWLLGIARHLAMHHRRGERRRQRREERRARPEAAPPDTSIDDRDTLRLLTEAVLALPEPYAGVLLQRYLRDRTPQEIAAATGVPVATVKSQLQRGLVLLRERLQQRGGDWRAALCVGFGIESALPAAAGTVTVTSGVLLMGSVVKLAAAAAALLALAGGVWWGVSAATPAAAPGAATDPGAAAIAAGTSTPRGDQTAPPAAASTQRVEVPTPAPPPRASLIGRCVDESGAPIAGVIAWLRCKVAGRSVATPPWPRQERSASNGRFLFTFELLPKADLQLNLHAEDCADAAASWKQPAADARIDVGDVVMHFLVRAQGLLVDEDGAPVRDASLHFRRIADGAVQPGDYLSATADAAGRFATGDMASGSWQIEVPPREVVQGATAQLSRATADLRIVVRRLDPLRVLAGVVVDEAGQGLADVEIRLPTPLQLLDRQLHRTRRDGSFELIRPEGAPPEPVALTFDKPGFELLQSEPPLAWGRTDLRLVLRASAGQVVQVVRADDDQPVEAYTLYAMPVPMPGQPSSSRDNTELSGLHPDGRATLHLRAGSWRLLVHPGDGSLAYSDLVPFEVSANGTARAVVSVQPQLPQVVRVVRADGSPVAGAEVRRCLPPPDGPLDLELVMPLANWTRQVGGLRSYLLLEKGVTDARGEVVLHGGRQQTHALQLPGPDHAPCTVPAVRFGDGAPVLVTVSTGALLRGRCTPRESLQDLQALCRKLGGDPAGDRPRLQAPSLQLRGSSAARYPAQNEARIAIAEDGTFAAPNAPPGDWELRLHLLQSMGGGVGSLEVPVGRVTLREGETSDVVVDLAALQCGRGSVDATVLLDGEPLADTVVLPKAIVPDGSAALAGRSSATMRTDAAGHLQFEGWQGRYQLFWSPTNDLFRGERIAAEETFELVRGQRTAVTLHLRTGTLRVRVLDAEGKPVAGVAVELVDAAGQWRATLPATDADGRSEQRVEAATFDLRALPAALLAQHPGRAGRRRQQPGEDPLAASLIPLGKVTVTAATATEATLHLPVDAGR